MPRLSTKHATLSSMRAMMAILLLAGLGCQSHGSQYCEPNADGELCVFRLEPASGRVMPGSLKPHPAPCDQTESNPLRAEIANDTLLLHPQGRTTKPVRVGLTKPGPDYCAVVNETQFVSVSPRSPESDLVEVFGVGGATSDLFAFDRITGEERWHYGASAFLTVLPHRGLVQNGFEKTTLINPETGAPLWQVPYELIGGGEGGSFLAPEGNPLVDDDGDVLLQYPKYMEVLSGETGAVRRMIALSNVEWAVAGRWLVTARYQVNTAAWQKHKGVKPPSISFSLDRNHDPVEMISFEVIALATGAKVRSGGVENFPRDCDAVKLNIASFDSSSVQVILHCQRQARPHG